MRFIHTADWHLGAWLHGSDLIEDQAYVLDQLVDIVKSEKPDFLLVAGDIYDKKVQRPDAVNLLDDVIKRIVLNLKVPMIMIAGNHDSRERLNFCADLIKNQGLHIFSKIEREIKPMVLYDDHGPFNIVPLTYADPSQIKEIYKVDDCQDHNEAMRIVLNETRKVIPKGERSLICAHVFVAGADVSDSESPLSVGGTGAVDATYFEDFTYTALGHLHRPQRAKSDNIRYSGSILKYSFSEQSHVKGVDLVEIGKEGVMSIEHIPLLPKRDLKIIKGKFEELLMKPQDNENYVMAVIEDEEPILDLMPRLRKVYKGLLHIEKLQVKRQNDTCISASDYTNRTILELFSSFYEQVSGDKLTEKQIEVFKEAHTKEYGGELK